MRRLLLGVCCLMACLASAAQAMPEAARAHAESWNVLGKGQMSWFGLRLYTAELWSSQATFDATKTYALKLTYDRSFAGLRLSSASIDQMRRIGITDEAALARWQQTMDKVFPDVKEGDTLTGVFLPGKGAVFYLGSKLQGEVNDAAFAAAFFGIWLDARTSEPALRRQLIGGR